MTLADDWTVVTADGSRASHWEHSVARHADGVWVLTAEDGGAAGLAPYGIVPVPPAGANARRLLATACGRHPRATDARRPPAAGRRDGAVPGRVRGGRRGPDQAAASTRVRLPAAA